jgi:2-phosphosulfolactate phosphatase
MHIEIIPSADHCNPQAIRGKTVVMIDVLRATSVIVTALDNGAESVIPVVTVEEAFELKKANPRLLLSGERNAMAVEGFDTGNSPLEFTPDVVCGRTVVLTTSNGTRAFWAAALADELLVGSFLNRKAMVDALIPEKKDVVLLCAGTNGEFSMDDALCAGGIVAGIEEETEVTTNDFTLAMSELYRENCNRMHQFLGKTNHYNVLMQKGFEKDLTYCLRLDVSGRIPRRNGMRIE